MLRLRLPEAIEIPSHRRAAAMTLALRARPAVDGTCVEVSGLDSVVRVAALFDARPMTAHPSLWSLMSDTGRFRDGVRQHRGPRVRLADRDRRLRRGLGRLGPRICGTNRRRCAGSDVGDCAGKSSGHVASALSTPGQVAHAPTRCDLLHLGDAVPREGRMLHPSSALAPAS